MGLGSSVDVGEGSSAKGILASEGSGTQSFLSSDGVIDKLNIDPWVKNSKGDYAEIGVTGTNLAGFTYKDNYYPVKNSIGNSDAVWAQQWIGASSVDSLHAYAKASKNGGETAGSDLSLSYGSLKGYYNAAYAGSASWLGMDRVASVQQTLDRANGNEIQAETWAVDSLGDAAGALTNVKYGTLSGYSVLANSAQYSSGLKAAGVSVDSISASAPNGLIYQTICSYDKKGDLSQVCMSLNNGNFAGNSLAYSINQWGVAESNQNIDAKGSVIDISAYAQNQEPGYEYLTSTSGSTCDITAPVGSAKFEFQTSNGLTASANCKATTDNVRIIPTLPSGTKTAIMLEPMNYAFTNVGGTTDLRRTIFPALVGKGYAVLSYDDAGSSSDKFQELGQYNVAVIDSHMNSNVIGLSTIDPTTNLDYLSANRIKYQTSKNSLVILSGCESFEGYPRESALAKAVSTAVLRGGYADSVEIHWDHDYLSYFFDALADGKTAIAANDNALTLARNKYGIGPFYVPLVLLGDQNFEL